MMRNRIALILLATAFAAGQIPLTPRVQRAGTEFHYLPLERGMLEWNATILQLDGYRFLTPASENLVACKSAAAEREVLALYRSGSARTFIVRLFDQDLDLRLEKVLPREADRGAPLLIPADTGTVLALYPDEQSYAWLRQGLPVTFRRLFPGDRFDLERKILVARTESDSLVTLHQRSAALDATGLQVLLWEPDRDPRPLVSLPLAVPYQAVLHTPYLIVSGTRQSTPDGSPEFHLWIQSLTDPGEHFDWRLASLPESMVVNDSTVLALFRDHLEGYAWRSGRIMTRWQYPEPATLHGACRRDSSLYLVTSALPEISLTGYRFSRLELVRIHTGTGVITRYALPLTADWNERPRVIWRKDGCILTTRNQWQEYGPLP